MRPPTLPSRKKKNRPKRNRGDRPARTAPRRKPPKEKVNERPSRSLHEQPGADGGRADQPRRARLRHLFAPVEGADHLPRRPRQRHGREPDLRPAPVPRKREPDQ